MGTTIRNLKGGIVFEYEGTTLTGAIHAASRQGVTLQYAEMEAKQWEYAYLLERKKAAQLRAELDAIKARAELKACKAPVARLETEARRTPPAPVAAPEVAETFPVATEQQQAALRLAMIELQRAVMALRARILVEARTLESDFGSIEDGHAIRRLVRYRLGEVGDVASALVLQLENANCELRVKAEGGA